MNWSKLFFTKESLTTTSYHKAEWSAHFQEIPDICLSGPLPTGGKATKIGSGRCEIEAHGAFAPEARGEFRMKAWDMDLWGEGANDRFAISMDDALRLRLDEPALVRETIPEIVFEKPRGKAANVLVGATRGEKFLGYVPLSLATRGVMAFIFGSNAIVPWFVPAREPWEGKKLIEGPKVPERMAAALADEAAWKALVEENEKFLPAILVARGVMAALQYVRYG